LLICLAWSCREAPDNVSPSATTLTVGVPESTVEAAELGVQQLANQITQEGLTQLAVEGRALPRLATSWTWELDERRLRILLRDDVFLHDGSQLDSQRAAEAIAVAIAKFSNRA